MAASSAAVSETDTRAPTSMRPSIRSNAASMRSPASQTRAENAATDGHVIPNRIGNTVPKDIAASRTRACDKRSFRRGRISLPRRKLLLSHARVLEAAMSFGTVLPMRFGMTCPSVAAFSALVCDAGERIDAAFDRIEGRIEVGARVSVSDTAALEAAMAKSAQLQARRDALALKGREAHFAKVDFGRDLGEAV